MASTLPAEIILLISNSLQEWEDLAALTRTSKWFYTSLNQVLYARAANTNRKRPLFWAAAHSQPRTVQRLLDLGVDPNWTWHSKHVHGEHRPYLLSTEVDFDDFVFGPDSEASSESHWNESVADDRHLESVEQRWNNHPPVDGDDPENAPDVGSFLATHKYYWTALHIAADRGHDEVVSILLDRGADPNAPSRGFCECKPVIFDQAECQCVAPKRLFGNDGFPGGEEHDFTKKRRRPLSAAISKNHLSTVRILIARGALSILDYHEDELPEVSPDSDAAPVMHGIDEESGITSLHAACMQGSLEMAKLLFERDYTDNDVDIWDASGQTPLDYAYLYENWDCFDWLLSVGADINTHVGDYGTGSLLLDAIRNKRFRDACRLIEAGADVNANVLPEGYPAETALRLASEDWHVRPDFPRHPKGGCTEEDGARLLKLLIEKGVDLDSEASSGFSPLGAAAKFKNLGAARILLDAGINPNGRFKDDTPLILACKGPGTPLPELVQLLLNRGARVYVETRDGDTPLEIACAQGPRRPNRLEIIRVLVDHGAASELHIREVVVGPLGSPEPPKESYRPLEIALEHGDTEAFAIVLAACPEPPTSAADIRDLFSAMLKRPRGPSLESLLKMDVQGHILQDDQSIDRILGGLVENQGARYPIAKNRNSDTLPEMVISLLDKGVRCSEKSLGDAVRLGCTPELIKRLAACGADPNQETRDQFGHTARPPLAIAASAAFVVLHQDGADVIGRVEALLDVGANVHRAYEGKDPSRWTPLIAAIRNTHPANPLSTGVMKSREDIQNDRSARKQVAATAASVVEIMLRRQPFNYREPSAPTHETIDAIIRSGAYGVLRRLVDQDPYVAEHLVRGPLATNHLHKALDQLNVLGGFPTWERKEWTIGAIDDLMDCVGYLLPDDMVSNCDQVWGRGSRPGKGADLGKALFGHQTAAEKLAVITSPAWGRSSFARGGIYHCFSKRFRCRGNPDLVIAEDELLSPSQGSSDEDDTQGLGDNWSDPGWGEDDTDNGQVNVVGVGGDIDDGDDDDDDDNNEDEDDNDDDDDGEEDDDSMGFDPNEVFALAMRHFHRASEAANNADAGELFIGDGDNDELALQLNLPFSIEFDPVHLTEHGHDAGMLVVEMAEREAGIDVDGPRPAVAGVPARMFRSPLGDVMDASTPSVDELSVSSDGDGYEWSAI